MRPCDDDRIDAMIRRQNIRRSEPHPVWRRLPACPHHPSDSHPDRLEDLLSCGSDLLAEAAAKFIFAKSKKARKKAAKRLRRLAD